MSKAQPEEKKITIDGKEYSVPKGFDSTKHTAKVENGKVVITDTQTNKPVDLSPKDDKNTDAKA